SSQINFQVANFLMEQARTRWTLAVAASASNPNGSPPRAPVETPRGSAAEGEVSAEAAEGAVGAGSASESRGETILSATMPQGAAPPVSSSPREQDGSVSGAQVVTGAGAAAG
ncbi:unnamed protein product, partial [Discosporangium mesarthrocarpum]